MKELKQDAKRDYFSRRQRDAEILMISCPEEIAYRAGWIDTEQLRRLAEPLSKNAYGHDLAAIAKGMF
ncbi:MAG: hypothetical protein B6I25_02350 [Planctomycetales bacterium 4572_13]|nr:MAG: hypothetical protein B6I25_02350 [Planctomycetales bacterium 4572_13]